MEIKDRIVEFRRVPADSLKADDRNWRAHPRIQRDAFNSVLESVGIAGAALVRTGKEGELILIDGHMRVEELRGQDIPILITDLSEEEAGEILLTHDAITLMAEAEQEKLDALMAEQEDRLSPSLREVLSDLQDSEAEAIKQARVDGTLYEQAIQLKPNREYIVVMCETDLEFELLRSLLKLDVKRRGGRKRTTNMEEVGVERVVSVKRLLDAVNANG